MASAPVKGYALASTVSFLPAQRLAHRSPRGRPDNRQTGAVQWTWPTETLPRGQRFRHEAHAAGGVAPLASREPERHRNRLLSDGGQRGRDAPGSAVGPQCSRRGCVVCLASDLSRPRTGRPSRFSARSRVGCPGRFPGRAVARLQPLLEPSAEDVALDRVALADGEHVASGPPALVIHERPDTARVSGDVDPLEVAAPVVEVDG
jgi:hypothetical protein